MKIQYYAILTIDIFDDTRIRSIKPSVIKSPLWTVTETVPDEKETKRHRKYTALLTAAQLKALYDNFGYVDTCNTMGAITEYGWLPAVSWDIEDLFNARINVYVSPLTYPENNETTLFESLPDPEKEIKRAQVNYQVDKIMDLLKNVNDIEIPFPEAIETNFEQVEILL